MPELGVAQSCSAGSLKAWRGWSDLPRVPFGAEGREGPVCAMTEKLPELWRGAKLSPASKAAVRASKALPARRSAV